MRDPAPARVDHVDAVDLLGGAGLVLDVADLFELLMKWFDATDIDCRLVSLFFL